MSERILESVDKKLDVIIKLIANLTIQEKSQTESSVTLGALGLDRNTIAEIVRTTPQTVSSRLSEAKKKIKPKGKNK